MFDGTSIHAHVSAAAQKGKKNQVLGRSRGEFGTKIHIKVDRDGHLLDFHLTTNQTSDSRQFEPLLDLGPDGDPRR